MQVSPNIVRFPLPQAHSVDRVETKAKPGDNVIAFEAASSGDMGGFDAREHGLLFAAQRIVARVADGLDRTATL